MAFPWAAALGAVGQSAQAAPATSGANGGQASSGGINVTYNNGFPDWSNPLHIGLVALAALVAFRVLKK